MAGLFEILLGYDLIALGVLLTVAIFSKIKITGK
jgi:hypothetical protein